jgi:protein-disulfide isomerase
MNLIKTILIAGVALFSATFTFAAGLGEMNLAEREAFGEAVRAYLLENPEVILEAIEILERRDAAAEAQTDLDLVQNNYADLTRDGFSWVGGNPDGTITIVEFSDYRCTFCKRAHPEVMALLEANDDVRFVLKEFPILGADSTLASKTAISVLINQGGEVYGVFYDLLMAHNGAINVKTLSRLIEQAGGDAGLMVAHMDDPVVTQIIAKNRAMATTMKITGTPTFIIGGEMMRGFAPASAMQRFVDRARSQLQTNG